jgi:hypothetical protein
MQTQIESIFSPRKISITATPVASLVDELGEVKATVALLAKRENEIIELLKRKGVSVYQGRLFEANVFESSRSSLDVKALIAKHPKLAPTISKFTKTTPLLVCKVQAKVQR